MYTCMWFTHFSGLVHNGTANWSFTPLLYLSLWGKRWCPVLSFVFVFGILIVMFWLRDWQPVTFSWVFGVISDTKPLSETDHHKPVSFLSPADAVTDTKSPSETDHHKPVSFLSPVIKYEVSVVTGNLWNAGTDANVYLTVYGDRGDTGVRQLYSPSKDQVFRKGQVRVSSVLGHLPSQFIGTSKDQILKKDRWELACVLDHVLGQNSRAA